MIKFIEQWVFCVPQTTERNFLLITNLTQNQSDAQALPTAFKLKSFNGFPIIGNINNLTTNSQFQKLTKLFIIIYSNGYGGFGDIK